MKPLAFLTIQILTVTWGPCLHAAEPFSFEGFESYDSQASLRAAWHNPAAVLDDQNAFAGKHSLRLDINGDSPASNAVRHKFTKAQDWSHFDTLSFYYRGDIKSPAVRMTCKLTGADGETLAKHVVVVEESSPWRVGSVDLSKVAGRTAVAQVELRIDCDKPSNKSSVFVDDLSVSRTGRWQSAMKRFEALDAEHPPKPGGVLFVGSSSIRMWDTDKWFPNRGVINRGFGGSQISDVNRYADLLVFRHAPRIIVFYAGDNDVAAGKTAGRVYDDFRAFADRVQEHLPETHLVYIPIKPSLARLKLWPTMRDANERMHRLAEQRNTLHYADIVAPMLNTEGKPRRELFLKDGLHLNEQGYAIWTDIVKRIMQDATTVK